MTVIINGLRNSKRLSFMVNRLKDDKQTTNNDSKYVTDRRRTILTLRSRKGITLVEMMVAIIVLSIFILAVGTILTSSWRFWNSGWEQVGVQRDASYAFARIEKVIRNGSTATVLGGGSSLMVIKNGTSGWTRTFQVSGDVLQLIEGSTTENITSGVNSINFSTSADTVTITLTLQEGDSRTDFKTTIFLRNSS